MSSRTEIKKLILKSMVFSVLIFGSLLYYLNYYSRGYVDNFYTKFTAPHPKSLIMGSSRALQGLIPEEIFKDMNPNVKPALNFAFTSVNSPFGDVYLNAIRRRLQPLDTGGVFIIEVNPLSIMADFDSVKMQPVYPEENLVLNNQLTFGYDPNFEYLLKHYPKPLYKLLLNNNHDDKTFKLHDDGWLEVCIEFDSVKFVKNIERKTRLLSPVYGRRKFSSYRYEKLKTLANWLSQAGQVYLVRLPVAPEIAEMEFNVMNDFDNKMDLLTRGCGITYINLYNRPEKYFTIDGNHLHRVAAYSISKQLNNVLIQGNK